MNTAQLSRSYPSHEHLIVRGEGVDDISAFMLLSKRMEAGGGRGQEDPAKKPVLISPQVSFGCGRDGTYVFLRTLILLTLQTASFSTTHTRSSCADNTRAARMK